MLLVLVSCLVHHPDWAISHLLKTIYIVPGGNCSLCYDVWLVLGLAITTYMYVCMYLTKSPHHSSSNFLVQLGVTGTDTDAETVQPTVY